MKSIGITLSLSCAFLTVLLSCSSSKEQLVIDDNHWVDLTYAFDSTTLYWPNNPNGFEHHVDFKGQTPLGYFYSSYSVCAPEHGGTHLDAPIHFAEGKHTVDELPLKQLCGNAVVIDVSTQALKNRDFLIGVADIENWEKENGTINDSSIVLFKTGYGQYYPNREKYFGTALRGLEAIPLLHFPGIDPNAAKWLVEKRKVKAVGLDTPSLDYGQSKDFQTHRVLMGANCPGFENVAHLDKLPSKGIYIMALPMKIGAGSGSPLRIVANVMKPLN